MMVRVAVVGTGWYSSVNHLPVLKAIPGVEIAGICDTDPTTLATVSNHFGIAFATRDFRELAACKPDAAIVASANHAHAEQVLAFLEAGAHVLVEKPMTLTAAEAWALVAAAGRNKRELLVAYGWNYKPHFAMALELLRQDEIGQIESVVAHQGSPVRRIFTGDLGEGRWSGAVVEPKPETWRSRDRGGGFTFGQLSHLLGFVFGLLPLDTQSVSAVMHGTEAGLDLGVMANTSFRGGAVASLSGVAGVPEQDDNYCNIILYGSRGSMIVDTRLDHVSVGSHRGGSRRIALPQGCGKYDCIGPVEALVATARGESRNLSDGAAGARAVQMIEAMHASARAGGSRIDLSDVRIQ
jgi:predicted dehydrogenase